MRVCRYFPDNLEIVGSPSQNVLKSDLKKVPDLSFVPFGANMTQFGSPTTLISLCPGHSDIT